MEESPDSRVVEKVANHNGNEPREVILSSEEGIQVLGEVIFILEIYDINSSSFGRFISYFQVHLREYK